MPRYSDASTKRGLHCTVTVRARADLSSRWKSLNRLVNAPRLIAFQSASKAKKRLGGDYRQISKSPPAIESYGCATKNCSCVPPQNATTRPGSLQKPRRKTLQSPRIPHPSRILRIVIATTLTDHAAGRFHGEPARMIETTGTIALRVGIMSTIPTLIKSTDGCGRVLGDREMIDKVIIGVQFE